MPGPLPWEVIVVDNASTDGMAAIAREIWRNYEVAPLRVICEERLGKMNGFRLGCEEARFEILAFLDDDNWPDPDWLATAHRIMADNPKIGACGGFIEAECETPPPEWFVRHAMNYAVGAQADVPGDMTDSFRSLWGAGMILRRRAWQELVEKGFQCVLSCRKGNQLTAGGDSEICHALRMAGWRIWYDPRLRLKHFMPASRLKVEYLRRLCRGFGAAVVVLRAYEIAISTNKPFKPGRYIKKRWHEELHMAIGWLWMSRLKICRAWFSSGDDHLDDVVEVDFHYGRLMELLKERSRFDDLVKRLQEAPWRTLGRPSVRTEGANGNNSYIRNPVQSPESACEK